MLDIKKEGKIMNENINSRIEILILALSLNDVNLIKSQTLQIKQHTQDNSLITLLDTLDPKDNTNSVKVLQGYLNKKKEKPVTLPAFPKRRPRPKRSIPIVPCPHIKVLQDLDQKEEGSLVNITSLPIRRPRPAKGIVAMGMNAISDTVLSVSSAISTMASVTKALSIAAEEMRRESEQELVEKTIEHEKRMLELKKKRDEQQSLLTISTTVSEKSPIAICEPKIIKISKSTNTTPVILIKVIDFADKLDINVQELIRLAKEIDIKLTLMQTITDEQAEQLKAYIKSNTIKAVVEENIHSNYDVELHNISNISFEKIRRYYANLVKANKADILAEEFSKNAKLYKAIVYDALEQFMYDIKEKEMNIIDWGCGQGIGVSLVLDYIKEKQLDIRINKIILIEDDKEALNRAKIHCDVLKQNDLEIITMDIKNSLETLDTAKEGFSLNLFVNDNEIANFHDVPRDGFTNDYFLCLSAENTKVLKNIYSSFSLQNDIKIITDRESKIGRFEKYEKVFSIKDTLINFDSKYTLCVMYGYHCVPTSVGISPDGKFIVSGSVDGTINLWDIKSARKIKIFEGHIHEITSVLITSDGKFIVSGSVDGTIKLWDIKSAIEIETFEDDCDETKSIILSPDGKFIVSGSVDGTIKLWNIKNTSREIKPFKTKGHINEITAVVISPDGKFIVSGSMDGMIQLWDINSGREIRSFNLDITDEITAVVISPDGKFIVSGNMDGIIKLWDVNTGREMKSFKGHNNMITLIKLTPDKKFIVFGSIDGIIKLWDINSGIEIKTFKGHNNEITFVIVTQDGRFIVSRSIDEIIKLWDIKSGKEIKTFEDYIGVTKSIVLSPDGRFIVSVNLDETIKLWDIGMKRKVLQFVSFDSKEWVVSGQDGYYNCSDSAYKYFQFKDSNHNVLEKSHPIYQQRKKENLLSD